MLSLFATAAIKAVLEWLTSLLLRWKEKLDNIEQGRQEVIQAIEKKNKEAEDELKKVGKAASNSTDDELAAKLRDGYNRQRKSDMSGG